MSKPENPPVAAPASGTRWLRPWWLAAGLALGLIAMAGAGRRAAREDYHPGFTRFFPAIAPEASYYPTVDEMCAIVRTRCRRDQILVIVGGNSVLYGVWQPAEVMWTKRLQERLGDRYCVINFALRGASPMDGGAVVAEVLRAEYPRIIYIANEKPATRISPIGNDTYRFIFWQAYFEGRLVSYAPRNQWVRGELLDHRNWGQTPGIAGGAWLDRVLRFRDFWNRLAFEKFNTIPSLYAPAPPALFGARRLFEDQEPDGTDLTLDRRYLPAAREAEMKILRGTTVLAYERGPNLDWRLAEATRGGLLKSYRDAMAPEFRPRTLIVVGRDSPFFRRQLAPDEQTRDEQGIRDAVTLLRESGYESVDYGKDFAVEDYADRTHLDPKGGEKLADTVAPVVKAMAEKLNYLK